MSVLYGLLVFLSAAAVVCSYQGTQSCSLINSSTSVEITSKWRAKVQIILNAYSVCGQFPDVAYRVQVVGGLPSYSSCEGWTVQDAPMHWSTTTTCELPSDGGYNWTLVAESAHSGEIAYKHWHQFYTTDVQRITVTSGATDLHITCYFAPGSTCEGCYIQIELIGLDVPPEVIDEVEANRSTGSLESAAVVRNLLPNHRYRVTAYDIQQSGNVSDVGVPLHGFPVQTANHHGNQEAEAQLMVIISVCAATVVTLGCILGVVVATFICRDKVKVSVKEITHRRQASRMRPHDTSKTSHRGDSAPDSNEAKPPKSPPRLPNARSELNTDSIVSPESTGIPNPLSADSGVFVTPVHSGSTTTVEINTCLSISDPEDLSSDSEAPPIPIRSAELSENISPLVPPRSSAYYECAGATSISVPEFSLSRDPPPLPPKPGVNDSLDPPPKFKNKTISSVSTASPDGCSRAMPLLPPVPLVPKSAPNESQDGQQEKQELSESDLIQVPECLPPRNIIRRTLSPQPYQAGGSITTLPNPAYQTHCLEVGSKSFH